eukprot:gb/GECG01006578.1/.p1 GENE.gb/GECG01006578.1/~~gb/GECG01006578.1/.p1  ORF type:complete len:511 (+),score=53.15 gb/GECG01006578.1/:1-1533(+)
MEFDAKQVLLGTIALLALVALLSSSEYSTFIPGFAAPTAKKQHKQPKQTGAARTPDLQGKKTDSGGDREPFVDTTSRQPPEKSRQFPDNLGPATTSDKVMEDMSVFKEVIHPLRRIADLTNKKYHRLSERHERALEADKVRTLVPANYVGRHLSIPKPIDPKEIKKKHNNFLWGTKSDQSKVKQWKDRVCKELENRPMPGVTKMQELPFVNDSNALVQRSFEMFNVNYDSDVERPIFPDNGRPLEEPYCDLRKCDQSKFPFIYFMIAHRNRPANLQRLVASFRNATLQCESPPEWLPCLCIYVSDYGTSMETELASRLANTWKDRVRLLSRRNVTRPFTKGRTYNVGLRYVQTPANRSLIYEIDSDLIMTDWGAVNRALRNTLLGRRVTFPIIWSTKPRVKNLDTFNKYLLNGTITSKKNAYKRSKGYGMTTFYLYDNPFGLCGPFINRSAWGLEDNVMYTQAMRVVKSREMKKPGRYEEKSLWHIFHSKNTNWKKSKDGIGKKSRARIL